VKQTTSLIAKPTATLSQSRLPHNETYEEDRNNMQKTVENQIEDPMINWTIDTMDWNKPTKCDGTVYVLKNGHDKCMAVNSSDPKFPTLNGSTVVQSDCNPSEKGQLWRWKKKRRLCNNWDKCLTVFKSDVVLWENIDGEIGQEWYFIRNDLYAKGFCVLPYLDSVANEAKMVIEICAPKKKGKSWNFYKEMTKKFE